MASMEMTLAQLSADLEAQARRLAAPDLTAAMRSSALAAKASVLDNFAGQHAPDGEPWAPLKRERRRKRDKRGRKRGDRQQILLDTGLLRASYQSGASHVENVGPLSLEMGSNLDRAAWTHFGTSRMVARPQLGWNESLQETVTEIVADHLAKQLGA